MNATGVTQHSLDVRKAALAAENPLLGTWKLQSLVYKMISTGDCSSPFGDHPQGYLSYSLDGRMYAIGVFENRPKPGDSVPTDEEQAQLQGSMFAYAGTYTADGEQVVHHVDISWNQSWTGTDLIRFYKLDGDTLTITTARTASPIDGEEGEFILVWKKVQRES
jgi:Lipocalin-like domain